MSGLILAGDLYIDILSAAGARTGLLEAVNCTQFAFTESSDLKQRTSRGKATYGQALDVQGIKKPGQLDITVDESSKEVFAMAILGAISSMTKVAGEVEAGDEQVTAVLGKIVQLANLDVTGLVLKSHATPATSYVLGEDYEIVSPEAGLIRILADGAITDGELLDPAYSYGAQAGSIISGGAQPTVNAYLYLDGKNLVTGKGVIAEVDCAIFTPKSALDLLNGDFVPYKLGSTLKTLPGQTSPYRVKLKGVN